VFNRAKHIVEVVFKLEIDTDRKVLAEDIVDEMRIRCQSTTPGGVIRSCTVVDIQTLKSESTETVK